MNQRILLSLGLCVSLLLCVTISTSAHADYTKLAEKGLSARQLDNNFPDDLWEGLSYEEFNQYINTVYAKAKYPVYRNILIDLLLAEHEGFDIPAEKQKRGIVNFADIQYKDQELTEEQSLSLLKLRFETLYKLGAFDEANRLYKEIFGRNTPEDQTLLLYGLYPLLIEGNFGGFCLDLKTLQIETPSPHIQDLNKFCNHYFDEIENEEHEENAQTEQSSIETAAENKTEPTQAPISEAALAESQELKSIESFSSLPVLNILFATKTPLRKEIFEKASLTEKLISHALERVDANIFTSYGDTPAQFSLETLKILSYQNAAHLPRQACVMNEAYLKGLIPAEALLLFYESISLPTDKFDKSSYAHKTLHNCQKPAWYIHYINQADNDEQRAERKIQSFKEIAKAHPMFLRAYAEIFKDIPLDNITAVERWFLAESLLKEGIDFSKKWKETVRTNRENGIADSQETNSKVYIFPDWYLQVLHNNDTFKVNDYFIWNQTGFTELPFSGRFAPSRPLTSLKTMLNLDLYQETIFQHYEKLFLLTFSRNYVIYSDSLIHRIDAAVENEHSGKSLLLLLHILSNHEPADIYPQYGNYLLDLLTRIGYKLYARHFIVDTLSVGKK
jgi:hypothetical protein